MDSCCRCPGANVQYVPPQMKPLASTRLRMADEAAIAEAASLLRAGRLVALPTETVYGLAAHAFDAEAILAVFRAKRRPSFDPLIVHLLGAEELPRVVAYERLTAIARERVEALTRLWPGPLTLVLPKAGAVPDHATSGLDTVAVRAPAHSVARAVLRTLNAPFVAPSANRFGRISPTCPAHVLEELDGEVPLILDGGPTEHGLESTIVGVEDDGTLHLLRPGATPQTTIEEAVSAPLRPPPRGPMRGPGMLASHYAPRIPLALETGHHEGPVAWLLFESRTRDDWAPLGPPVATERLGTDDRKAARELFAALRRLDASGAAWILAEIPRFEGGLGPAIRDRLARAAADRTPRCL